MPGKILSAPTTKNGLRLLAGIIVGVVLLMVFAALAEDLLHGQLQAFDTVVGNFIRSFTTPGLTHAAILITRLCSAPVEIIILLVVAGLLYLQRKKVWEVETSVLAICLAGAWLLNVALKEIFHRSRPSIRHLVEAGGYSFPSGHAMVSAAFYGMLAYLLWMALRESSRPSWYVVPAAVLLVFFIGVSRVYLGVHFASDVIAGFAAGGAWLTACVTVLWEIEHNGVRLE